MTDIDLKDLEFRAEDFDYSGAKPGVPPLPTHQFLADRANAILREKLKNAPVVYCNGNEPRGMETPPVWAMGGQLPDFTHTARLVCIEEIPRIAAENLEGGF